MNAPVGAIDEQSKKCFELYTSRNTFFMSFLRFSGGGSLWWAGCIRSKSVPLRGSVLKGSTYWAAGDPRAGSLPAALVTSRKKKLRSDGFASFLSFSFFARPFLFGSFQSISPSAEGDRGVAPGPYRPLKRAALNFTPFVTQSLSWVLPGVSTAFCPKHKTASHNLARGVTASRLLLHPTPGTT